MRRRALLTTLSGTVGFLAGCQSLREEGYLVPDRGCSGPVLDKTNIPADRRAIRVWPGPATSDPLPERFPPLGEPPTITFDADTRRTVIRTQLDGDNNVNPENRVGYARVKRLQYDQGAGELWVAFISKQCKSSGEGVVNPLGVSVTVSFPTGLPTHVRAEIYGHRGELSVATTKDRRG